MVDKSNKRRDELLEYYGDGDLTLLSADGYDAAILGVAGGFDEPRLVYSVSKILQILMDGDDEPETDGDDKHTRAREWFDYNIAGGYVGEQTPVWVEDGMFR